MAADPKLVVRIAANLAELKKNLADGTSTINTTTASMQKLAASFRGDKLIQAAQNATAAVNELGGASKLSRAEQDRVNTLVEKALEKYRLLGREAPKAMQDLAEATRKAEQPTQGITTKMVALGAAIGTFVGTLAVDAFKRVASGVADIATNGIKLAPTVDAFHRLAAAAGQSGDEMLRVTRTATKGLITDLNIMQAANKGLLLGLPLTTQGMGELAKTAVVLGKAMGQDATKSLDDLITALGRSSPMILDNLGLSVKAGEANQAYARAVGIVGRELTDAEKKLAFHAAAMDAAKVKVEELGGIQLTLSDHVVRARNAFTNFTDALGVAVATSPVVTAAFGAIADSLQDALGDNQTVLVQKLVGYVNEFAIKLVDVAQVGVTTAGVLNQAWSGLQLVFSGTASIVTFVGLAFAKLVAGAAEVATKIPGLGDAFDGTARSARDMATFMEGVQRSFHDQAAEALEGVKGNSAFHKTLDGVAASLTTMRGKMVEASRTTADAAAIAEHLTKANGEVGASSEEAGKKALKAAKDLFDFELSMYKSSASTRQAFAQMMDDQVKRAEASQKKFAEQFVKTQQALTSITRSGLPYFMDGLEQVGQKSTEIARVTEEVRRTEKALDDAARAGGAFSKFLEGIPGLVSAAFTGGGGLAGAVKAMGSELGATLMGPEGIFGFGAGGALNGIANKLTKTFGDVLGFALPGIGGAIGSLMGPLIGKVGGWIKSLFGGPSKEELAGRDLVSAFEQQVQGTLTAGQRLEAGGESWRMTVIAVRDAYVATGRTAAEAEAAVKALWESSRQGAEASQAAIGRVQAVLDEAAETANQAAADAAAAETAAAASRQAAYAEGNKILDELDARRKSLADAIAKEAPEEVMGVIEKGQRAQLEVLNAEAEANRAKMKADALAAGATLEEALANIHPDPVHVPIIWDVPDLPSGQSPPVFPQAHGGDYWVTRPTMFLAGEAGPERATFTPAGQSAPAGGSSAGVEARLDRLVALQERSSRETFLAIRDALAQSGRRR